VLAAHVCNRRYSGGRDQEDRGSKPAPANSSRDPILKSPLLKSADGVAEGEGPEFKPQYHTHTHTKNQAGHDGKIPAM
jgi:hypothetical protein